MFQVKENQPEMLKAIKLTFDNRNAPAAQNVSKKTSKFAKSGLTPAMRCGELSALDQGRWRDEDKHHLRRAGLGEVFTSMRNSALSVLRFLKKARLSQVTELGDYFFNVSTYFDMLCPATSEHTCLCQNREYTK